MSIFYNISVLILLTVNGVPAYVLNQSTSGASIKLQTHQSSPEMRRLYEDVERLVYNPGVDLPHTLQEQKLPSLLNKIQSENIMQIKEDNKQQRDDQQISEKTQMIFKLLEDPSLSTLPIVYVEDILPEATNEWVPNMGGFFNELDKRSGRYYRRYPWKRQNSRYRPYEADTRYTCVPSREEVLKLLVGLHESHNGNDQKTVNFCNRKRPAKNVFANIRFLG